MLLKARQALQPPVVHSPKAVHLVITGSGAAIALQCKSTVTCTGCVAATALEGAWTRVANLNISDPSLLMHFIE